MKKLLFILAFCISAFSANAQGFGVGISGGYLSELDGIGASGDLIYDLDEHWGIATNATFAVAEGDANRAKWFAVDLNAHYKVYKQLYLLAGGEYLNITIKQLGLGGGSIGQESKASNGDFGINVGSGYKYNLIDNVNIFAEAKYVIIDTGYFHARLGLQFDF
jgi:hypothetical protein